MEENLISVDELARKFYEAYAKDGHPSWTWAALVAEDRKGIHRGVVTLCKELGYEENGNGFIIGD